MHTIAKIGPILVTGAGGFLGGHLLRHLQRDPDATVIAGTRDGRGDSRQLDLLDGAGLQRGLAGVAAVVHCAVGDRAVTVDGTRALLAAAAAAGVRRFVHISSVAVYGLATGAITEASPMLPGRSGYAGWKAAAEEACLAQHGLEVVRLRPAIVYGPGSALWVATLARRIRSGRWGTFGSAGEGTCNLVHILDVVGSIRHGLACPGIAGAAFNISGTEPMTWNEWFTRMAHALGAPTLRSLSPLQVRARSLSALPLKLANRIRPGLAGTTLLGAPASSELALFGLKASYPTTAARESLGWAPQIGVEQGLAGCVEWLRQA